MLNEKLVVKKYSRKHFKNKRNIIYTFILLLILIGMTYQSISVYFHADEYARVGDLIPINNSDIHLYTNGLGNMNVIFTANIGDTTPYASWSPVYTKLTESAQITIYDKPGYGWSEITSAPRMVDNMAQEMASTLEKANIPSPYILVAHSLSSLEVLRFAQLYPERVAGIVLVDGLAPEFSNEINNILLFDAYIMNFSRNTGLLRLANSFTDLTTKFNHNSDIENSLQSIQTGLSLEKKWNRNMIAELQNIENNAEKVISGSSLGDIPLYILTSTNNKYGNWASSQKELLKLSTQSKQLFIEGSSEYIETKDVPTIVEAIEDIISLFESDEEYLFE